MLGATSQLRPERPFTLPLLLLFLNCTWSWVRPCRFVYTGLLQKVIGLVSTLIILLRQSQMYRQIIIYIYIKVGSRLLQKKKEFFHRVVRNRDVSCIYSRLEEWKPGKIHTHKLVHSQQKLSRQNHVGKMAARRRRRRRRSSRKWPRCVSRVVRWTRGRAI